MTAAAMIVGMLPMAIGGAGEEQNAVLARAVIGGLLFATPTTLLVVPYLFAMLRKGNDGKAAHGVFDGDPGMNEIMCCRSEPMSDRRSADTDRAIVTTAGAANASAAARGALAVSASLLLLLAGGLGSAAGAITSLNAEVVATAEQQPRLVPNVRVAPVRASGSEIMPSACPATTDGVRAGQYLCARQRLYRKAQCRYRRSRQGRRPAGGDHRARTRSPDRAGPGDAGPEQATLQQTAGQPRSREGHLGPRQQAGQARDGSRCSRATTIA